MTNTIYVVKREWENFEVDIIGVFTSKEQAIAVAREHSENRASFGGWVGFEIEEFPVNKEVRGKTFKTRFREDDGEVDWRKRA